MYRSCMEHAWTMRVQAEKKQQGHVHVPYMEAHVLSTHVVHASDPKSEMKLVETFFKDRAN